MIKYRKGQQVIPDYYEVKAMIVSPLLFVALTLAVELLAWLVAAAAGGVVETILSAAWTLAYRDLTGMGLTGEGPVQTT